MNDTKICTKCGEKKNIEDFSINDIKRGYRRGDCKSCTNSYNRRNWREHNPQSTSITKESSITLTTEEISSLLEKEKMQLMHNSYYKDDKRKCNKCLEFKPLENFVKNKHNFDGYHHLCKKCLSLRRVPQSKIFHKSKPWLRCYRSSKHRAKEMNLPFDLTEDFIKSLFEESDFICPILGTPMIVGSDSKWNVPSLDRIYPKLGYVMGNVRLISYRANSLRADATIEELEKVLKDLKDLL